jgi:hypothetical protein
MFGKTWLKVLAFAFACILAAASSCSAQSASCISVRVLNSKSGKSLKNVSIAMNASLPRSPKTFKTDLSGVVRLCQTDPMSKYLGFSFNAKFRSCSGYEFKTATILESGYLAPDTQCGGRTFKFTENPKAGELVILVRYVGWLERNTEWP